MPRRKTPLRAVAQGLAAGLAGTAVFTLYQELTGGSGGEDEQPKHWSDTPEPAQVGHRVAEGVFGRAIPLGKAGLVTQVVHWSYGTVWGAAYALIEESVGQPVVSGVALTTAVMVSDYTLLPAMKLYEPPWKYPTATLVKDFATHLVHGLAVAGAYRAIDALVGDRR